MSAEATVAGRKKAAKSPPAAAPRLSVIPRRFIRPTFLKSF
jgi:hypothetical protein